MKTTLNINIDLSSKGYSIPADITDKIHALFLDAGWAIQLWNATVLPYKLAVYQRQATP